MAASAHPTLIPTPLATPPMDQTEFRGTEGGTGTSGNEAIAEGLEALAAVAAVAEAAPATPVVEAAPPNEQPPRKYRVIRVESQSKAAEMAPLEMEAAAELGLPASSHPTPRVTTTSSCSCQFPDHHGVPCRHMIRVYQGDQENHLETFAEGMIADQWRDMTDEELESCMAAFAAALPAVHRPQDVAPSDRYSLLTSEFRGVAELASKNKEGFDMVRTELSSIAAQLRSDGKRTAQGGGAPKSKRVKRQESKQAAEEGEAAVEGGAAEGEGVRNPGQAPCKGRPQVKRHKTAQELEQPRKQPNGRGKGRGRGKEKKG